MSFTCNEHKRTNGHTSELVLFHIERQVFGNKFAKDWELIEALKRLILEHKYRNINNIKVPKSLVTEIKFEVTSNFTNFRNSKVCK